MGNKLNLIRAFLPCSSSSSSILLLFEMNKANTFRTSWWKIRDAIKIHFPVHPENISIFILGLVLWQPWAILGAGFLISIQVMIWALLGDLKNRNWVKADLAEEKLEIRSDAEDVGCIIWHSQKPNNPIANLYSYAKFGKACLVNCNHMPIRRSQRRAWIAL